MINFSPKNLKKFYNLCPAQTWSYDEMPLKNILLSNVMKIVSSYLDNLAGTFLNGILTHARMTPYREDDKTVYTRYLIFFSKQVFQNYHHAIIQDWFQS